MVLGKLPPPPRKLPSGKLAPGKVPPGKLLPAKLPPMKYFCEFFLFSNFYFYENFRP